MKVAGRFFSVDTWVRGKEAALRSALREMPVPRFLHARTGLSPYSTARALYVHGGNAAQASGHLQAKSPKCHPGFTP